MPPPSQLELKGILPDDIAHIVERLLAFKEEQWYGKVTLHVEAGTISRFNTEQSHQVPRRQPAQ
jgi:hypothetical protein